MIIHVLLSNKVELKSLLKINLNVKWVNVRIAYVQENMNHGVVMDKNMKIFVRQNVRELKILKMMKIVNKDHVMIVDHVRQN